MGQVRISQCGFETVMAFGSGVIGTICQYLPHVTRRVFLVTDSTVINAHGPAILDALAKYEVLPLSFPAGEQSKTLDTVATLWDQMAALGCDRTASVVALGGGVVSDIAGFLAATMLRGLTLINVPTTVIGAVDAAIGGKNAVDIPAGKNLIGTFYWPKAVLIDPNTLETLPLSEWRVGLVEVLKYGVIAKPDILDQVAKAAEALQADGRPTPELLFEAACVKARVVEQDPLEQGPRRILNFGHTVGHAIEAASQFQVPHGAAVAAGMTVEARVATKVCGFARSDSLKVEKLVQMLGFQPSPPCSFAQALPYMRRDKKAVHGLIRMSLPKALGVMEAASGGWAIPVNEEVVRSCWDA